MLSKTYLVQARLMLSNAQQKRVYEDIEKLDLEKWKNKTQYIIEALDTFGRMQEEKLAEVERKKQETKLMDELHDMIRDVVREELLRAFGSALIGNTEPTKVKVQKNEDQPAYQSSTQNTETGAEEIDEYTAKAMELIDKWDNE